MCPECANLQSQLAVIAKALDKLQKNNYTLSQTAEIWLDVLENKTSLRTVSYSILLTCQYDRSCFKRKKRNADQEVSAEEWLDILNPVFLISFKMF